MSGETLTVTVLGIGGLLVFVVMPIIVIIVWNRLRETNERLYGLREDYLRACNNVRRMDEVHAGGAWVEDERERIAYLRDEYQERANDYNAHLKTWPTMWISAMFGPGEVDLYLPDIPSESLVTVRHPR